jgi:hypothetical protein
MSGGSWDYLTYKVDEAADRLIASANARRRALGKHVRLVAKALHDIEWNDSGDGAANEPGSIDAVLNHRGALLSTIKEEAAELRRILDEIVNDASR